MNKSISSPTRLKLNVRQSILGSIVIAGMLAGSNAGSAQQFIQQNNPGWLQEQVSENTTPQFVLDFTYYPGARNKQTKATLSLGYYPENHALNGGISYNRYYGNKDIVSNFSADFLSTEHGKISLPVNLPWNNPAPYGNYNFAGSTLVYVGIGALLLAGAGGSSSDDEQVEIGLTDTRRRSYEMYSKRLSEGQKFQQESIDQWYEDYKSADFSNVSLKNPSVPAAP